MSDGENKSSGEMQSPRPDLAMALDAIYAYATDPDNWEEMTSLLAHLDTEGDGEGMQTVIEGVRQHLARAEMLAQRLHEAPGGGEPSPSFCHMLVARDLRILDISPSAAALLAPCCAPLATGKRLSFNDPENAARFRAIVSMIGKDGEGEGPSLLRLVSETGEEAVFGYVVAEARLPDLLRRRLGLTRPSPEGAIVFVAPDREAASGEANMYRETFGLTPAEARLAARLKEGLSLKEAAEELGISVNTARNQIKSVFEKLGVNRQSDLIRHLTELSQLAAYIQVNGDTSAADLLGASGKMHHVPRGFVDLADGRRIAYREYGKAGGKPVLMLRSALGSSLIRPAELEAVMRRDIRLVVVERPGCGQSTPHPEMTYASFARDLETVVDVLNLDGFVLSANSSSVPMALSAALRLGPRVRRIMLTTARFEPPMPRKGRPGMVNYFFSNLRRHPWLLDSTLAILRAKMSRPFMRSLVFHFFEKSPVDFAQLERDPELVEALIDETMDSVGWSVQGLVNESQLMMQETPADFSGIAVPVTLWHGEADGVIPLEEMTAQLARTGLRVSEMRTFPGRGHLLLDTIRDEFYDAFLA
ncbi:MAG: alpha/beta fold hydrolase [Parvibaculum sp.]|jgi:pimeloyl-ACP methyl ester carboxylesterase/DNA-binding CsgD family transcriptional regulator|uniref:alpha/beta fold hydrolase n=1 Tax=Parvibaculum sp. TaxID=2024848 RepID=UPI00391A991B